MMKIDIHCHTTNRRVKDVAREDASIDAIAEEMDVWGIEKTVLLATYFPHKGSGISNYRMLNWISDRPEFCMFGSLDLETYFHQGINELSELSENRMIKGIKIYTCYQSIDLGSRRFAEVVSLAKKHSLPLMFHSGYSYASMRKYGRATIAEVVKPSDIAVIADHGVPIIISHMGKPFIDDLISVVKRHPNVSTDMSGLIDSKYDREEIPECIDNIKRFLDECGPHRILFGTDFPVQTHEDSVYMIEEAMHGFHEIDKRDVYHENARRLLELSGVQNEN